MFYEKKKKKKRMCKVNVLSIAPRQLTLSLFVKVILLKTFAHAILPVEAVCAGRALFMKN